MLKFTGIEYLPDSPSTREALPNSKSSEVNGLLATSNTSISPNCLMFKYTFCFSQPGVTFKVYSFDSEFQLPDALHFPISVVDGDTTISSAFKVALPGTEIVRTYSVVPATYSGALPFCLISISSFAIASIVKIENGSKS